MSFRERIQELQKELPGILVASAAQSWMAIEIGHHLQETEEILYWQIVAIAYFRGIEHIKELGTISAPKPR